MNKMKKMCIVAILLIFSLSISTSFTSEASAAPSRVIPVTAYEASKIGAKFSTTGTISRSELVTFLGQVKKAEASANVMNSARFGIAGSVVTFPLKRFGVSVTVGGASGILSYFIINKNLGSSTIQSKLNRSTSSTFKLTINYVKKTRGQTVWYEASSVALN